MSASNLSGEDQRGTRCTSKMSLSSPCLFWRGILWACLFTHVILGRAWGRSLAALWVRRHCLAFILDRVQGGLRFRSIRTGIIIIKFMFATFYPESVTHSNEGTMCKLLSLFKTRSSHMAFAFVHRLYFSVGWGSDALTACCVHPHILG